MSFDEDFFSTELCGVAILTFEDGNTHRFPAFFEASQDAVQTSEYSEIPTYQPSIICKEVDGRLINKGDKITINGRDYKAYRGPRYDPYRPRAQIFLTDEEVISDF
ncbi:hypothetical protein [Piscirickettsia litoralis]|uniref:Uncharacterized protein n=1 Tax=Piscirickettsia litoralis TaxID=1891921 RepID=A0ABX3A289_9GAMM|nr:hypothetical protein [Piscirickettsia litoralis]ODN41560.1 hypothetical protein BGC07_15745 [Piscirickettsia litoralis]